MNMASARRRMSAADRAAADKASEWIAQSHQLQARSKGAHKNAAMALLAMRGDMQSDVADAEEDQRKMSRQREEEAAVLFAQLNQVKENVASLRTLIESHGTGQEYVDSLRSTMDTVENDIFVVRQSHTSAFEALSTEEAQLNDAVKAMEAEILEWLSGEDSSKGSRPATAGARPGTSGPVHARSKVAAMINQPQLPPEVVAVDRILKEEGGSTGGWDDADHERFLRYRTMYKGQAHVYCAKTAEDLVDHDLASVERHELWYVRYLKLLDEKKAAIRSWRTTSKTSQSMLHDTQDVEGVSAQSRPSTAVEARRGSAEKLSREKQKAKIREWKEEKAREAAEAEQKRQEEELRLQREKEREAREREETKRRLSHYKMSKEADEEQQKQEEEDRKLLEKEKAKISVNQLERIRQRNRDMTVGHINLVQRKAEVEREKAKRVESLKQHVLAPEVERDPSRLTALTAASMAKRDARLARDGEEARPGYFAIMRPTLTHNPTRIVPSWRAGV